MNKEADCQSKQTFYSCQRKITYTSWMEGHEGTLFLLYDWTVKPFPMSANDKLCKKKIVKRLYYD
jgi:hypothetical protein